MINNSCILGDPADPNVEISYPELSEDQYEFQDERQQRISNNVRIPNRGPQWFVNRRTPNTLGCVVRVAADPGLQRTLQQQIISSNYSDDSEGQERNYQIGRHTSSLCYKKLSH